MDRSLINQQEVEQSVSLYVASIYIELGDRILST